MGESTLCPECGAEVAARAAPNGICPRCLLKLGFPDSGEKLAETTADAGITRTSLPTVDSYDRIGPYRILEKLGEGGMGEVYRAEQEDPIRRKVALKLIKVGMDTKQVVARFESERQALALMSHPNIAKVFEAGATEQGRPYFVMEYVQGVPITEYCDKHRLTTDERLTLFTQVCAGVQHAHQKGIIHRDIKPSNVLVGFEDGRPVPKIIDFGVAKATEQRLTEKSVFTQMGVLIGTPEYMSPEQAELTALDIDTRTDVYSLGVLLYELLVGALPFEPRELRRVAFDEICRKIREDEPSKPSARVSTLGGASAESASRRKTDPLSLTRELRGDLDWITMKALEKDRARRYPSPSEFAGDIERHLRHEPVMAGRPGAGYRAKKFIRRHRVGVGFAALLVIILAGSTALLAIQAARIARERDRANEASTTTEQVSEFLVGIFDVADPSEARGNTITAREVLDRGANRIEDGLMDQPRVRAKLLGTLGRVYENLGLYEQATELIEENLSSQRALFGSSDKRTFPALKRLAWLAAAQGRYAEAVELNRELLDVSRSVLGSDDPRTLAAMGSLANAYRLQGRYDDAKPLFREALEGQRGLLGVEDAATRATMYNFAVVCQHLGKLAEAEALRVEELALTRRIEGDDHPDALESLSGLANLYRMGRKYQKAEPLFLEALDGQRRVLGQDHPRTLDTKSNLASLYAAAGRFDKSERLFLEVIESERHRDSPYRFVTMGELADSYRRQGRYDEADQTCLETLDGNRRVLGDDHPRTLASLYLLARIRAAKGETEAALALLRQAIEGGYDAWGEPGKILQDWQDYERQPSYEAIVAGLREKLGQK